MIKRGNAKAPFVKGKTKSPTKELTIKDEEAIQKYKMYLEAERNYSEYTVLNYIKDVEDVIQIIDKPVEFMETNYPYLFNFFNPIVF